VAGVPQPRPFSEISVAQSASWGLLSACNHGVMPAL